MLQRKLPKAYPYIFGVFYYDFSSKIKVNHQIYGINSHSINSPSSRPVVLVALLTSKRLVALLTSKRLVDLLTRAKREALLPKQFQDIVALLGIAEGFTLVAGEFDAVVPFTQFGDTASGEFDHDV